VKQKQDQAYWQGLISRKSSNFGPQIPKQENLYYDPFPDLKTDVTGKGNAIKVSENLFENKPCEIL
jgi:hypothetical protein